MSLAGALLKTIDRPREAMAEVAQRARSWWLPAILLVISMSVLAWFSAPYQIELANERSAQIIERVTANMPEDQARLARESAREMSLPTYMAGAVGAGLAVAALGWVARGALVHFSSMAAGGTSTWGATFATCVWSMLPFFVRDLVQTAYVLMYGRVVEHQGLAFLVASGDLLEDSLNTLYSLMANVDPFALWHIVLLAVAIAVATKISRGKAFVMAVVVWGLFLGLKLLPVVFGRMATQSFLG